MKILIPPIKLLPMTYGNGILMIFKWVKGFFRKTLRRIGSYTYLTVNIVEDKNGEKKRFRGR